MSGEGSRYDLVLQGGRVMDPASGLDAVKDVAIAGRTVAEIADEIDAEGADTLDVGGLIVTPRPDRPARTRLLRVHVFRRPAG